MDKETFIKIKNNMSSVVAVFSDRKAPIYDGSKIMPSELAWTDNKGIYVNYRHPMLDKLSFNEQIVFITGLIVHEMLHLMFTDFDIIKYGVTGNRDASKRRLLSTINNLVEDPAIEYMAQFRIGGYILKCLRFMIWVVYKNTPELQSETDYALNQLMIAYTQYANMGLIKGEFTFPEAKECFVKTLPLFTEGIESFSPRTRFEVSEKITQIIMDTIGLDDESDDAMDSMASQMTESGRGMQPSGQGSASESISEDAKEGDGDKSGNKKKKNRKKTMEQMSGNNGSTDEKKEDEKSENKNGSSSSNKSTEKTSEDSQSGSNGEKREDGKENSSCNNEEGTSDDKSSSSNDSNESEGSDKSENSESGQNSDSSENSSDGQDSSDEGDGEADTTSSDSNGSSSSDGSDTDNNSDIDKSELANERQSLNNSADSTDSTSYGATDSLEEGDEEFEDNDCEFSAEEIQAIVNEIKTIVENNESLYESEVQDNVELPDLKDEDCVKHRYNVENRLVSIDGSLSALQPLYNDILEVVAEPTSNLLRNLKKIFRNDVEEKNYTTSGNTSLKRLSSGVKSSRVFERRQAPKDKNNMKVLLLIDESGSMRSESKSLIAKQTAIVLAEVFGRLKIPMSVMGFTTGLNGYHVNHRHYLHWRNTPTDRLRLLDISAHGGNYDALAVRTGCKLLKEKKSTYDVMIIISDGMPSFGPNDGIVELKKAVEAAKTQTKGNVIGIGLGNIQRSHFEAVYGTSFIHVPKISELPMNLTGAIKQMVKKW